LKRCER